MTEKGFINTSQRLAEQEELYRKIEDGLMARIRVACPGIIQSFDPDAQTAVVQPAIRESIVINGEPRTIGIPLLVDVPVVFPRAGGFLITLPVAAGDECLLVFSDSCIDAWWQSGGVQNQIDRRRHDLSDACALVGIWSQPRKVSGYSSTSAQIRNEAGTNYVELSASALTLKFGDQSIIIDGSEVKINP